MSFRLLSNRVLKHGKTLLQSYFRRNIYTNILEHGKNRGVPISLQKVGALNAQVTLRNSNGIFRFGQHARRLVIDNILNRVTPTYSADLRAQATKKLFYGDSAPFFALIGVSLATGAGVLSKDDELESVCWEIREAANHIQNSWNKEDISNINDHFHIDQLNVGAPIAKGCAAVVYAASFKKNQPPNTNKEFERSATYLNQSLNINNTIKPEMMSPIQNISRFVHNFGGRGDHLHAHHNPQQNLEQILIKNDDNPPINVNLEKYETEKQKTEKQPKTLEVNTNTENMLHDINNKINNTQHYPLALKMMFNYDIQSNAMSILRAMYKETVPARRRYLNNEHESEWEKLLDNQTLTLSPHPNIVTMYGYFCGEIRNFQDGHLLYPVAQPSRINPQGYGRNMSLYLLMKRYDCSLRALLDLNDINFRTRLLLFSQLLEAVAHISRHGIAHRDLKSDNILIEQNNDNKTAPLLVLSDFGCCLADKKHGLRLPYNSYDMDKGGNAALMAPEIINKTPGPFTILDYAKSDLWACGAIAYEIFDQINPFYSQSNGKNGANQTKSLKNINYIHKDLPKIDHNKCPFIVQQLIYNILNPLPSNRLSPDIAANVMQLFLWAPSTWLKSGGSPSSPEVLQWLLSLTTKMMSEGRIANSNELMNKMGRTNYIEYVLICSFLARAHLQRIRGALTWIQSVV